LSLDLNGGATVLGTVTVPATGGWQTWRTVSHTVNVNAGTYNLGVYAQAGGWNFNWLRITKQASAREAAAGQPGGADLSAGLRLYPNPARSGIHLQSAYDFSAGRLSIVDALGKEVQRGVYGGGKIDVSALPAGLYTLVVSKDGKLLRKRFVKM
jgi:hypothetical protein